ncbi:hypothetical protein EGI32_16995 [Ferruginibacter sp. HRS2-29]|nr:hypothetical protein [Ferruginibacter sp. HRS2-29]
MFACGKPVPARQFMFLNSGDKPLNLVVERDGKYEVDEDVPAHSNVAKYLKVGKVKLLAFDGKKCVQVFEDYEITKDSANQYTCIDLEGNIHYMLVTTSYLYGATNGLAQAIADAKGGNEKSFLGPLMSSEKPFVLDFAPKWPYEKLPKKIGALEASWALVPVYGDTADKAALIAAADAYLHSLQAD